MTLSENGSQPFETEETTPLPKPASTAASRNRTASAPRARRQTPRSQTHRAGTPDAQATTQLWERYRAARDANDEVAMERWRNELMERYLPLVRGAAERLLRTLPNSIELDDLVSAGLFGLMDAIRGFDPSRGIKFATYCSSRVRGSILDQLRAEDWVPRLVRRRAGAIDRANERLISRFGREPNHMELARELDVDHMKLARQLQNDGVRSMHSLSGKWDEDDQEGTAGYGDLLEDANAECPLGTARHQDMLDELTRSLSDRDRFIITQYYEEGRTLREIGEKLDLTESRVCQIHANVMDHLRVRFGARQQTLLM